MVRGVQIACVLSVVGLGAQSASLPAPGPGAFEVASIKPSPPPTGQGLFVDAGARPGGQWVASNAPLMLLVRGAYPGFPMPGQVIGGPAWINNDRYDITARAEGAPSADEMRGLVRQLLADRFKLKVHAESREMDVYALVLARPDGRLGPRIKSSASDCEALHAALQRGELPSTPPPRLEPGQRPECGMMSMIGNNIQRVSGGGMKMSNVASVIQGPLVSRSSIGQA